jgi:hypothetical protein
LKSKASMNSICSRNKQNANSHSMLYSQNGIDSKSRSKVKKRTACGYKGWNKSAKLEKYHRICVGEESSRLSMRYNTRNP